MKVNNSLKYHRQAVFSNVFLSLWNALLQINTTVREKLTQHVESGKNFNCFKN